MRLVRDDARVQVRPVRLFAGVAFLLTKLSEKDGTKKQLEAAIAEAGGSIVGVHDRAHETLEGVAAAAAAGGSSALGRSRALHRQLVDGCVVLISGDATS